MFEKYILENKQEIISKVCDLITFPSISTETSDKSMPFGKACNDSLKYFLNLAQNLGFKTKNVDGYCGWVEFGEGNELIGIVGHLDVVPAKEDDWQYSPFVPTIANGKIYGRGALDDKGPVVASLYAMKAVMDYAKEHNISINKRVRLIVGLNEEKDWKCIDYYKEHEEIPSLGFSPDSDFPCIYAEKGVISLCLSENLDNLSVIHANRAFAPTFNTILKKNINNSNTETKSNHTISSSTYPISIVELDCGNNAINVVPKFCSIILHIKDTGITSNLIATFKSIIEKYNYDIDLYKIDDSNLKLTSYGIAAHSAHPELGKNAISKLIIVLNEVFSQFNISFGLFSDFCKFIGDDYSGKGLNLDINDESGKLTLNASQLFIRDNKVFIGINLRVPVHTKPEKVVETFKNNFSCEVDTLKIMPALYVNKEDSLVQSLCSLFNETCQANFEPIAIGGATYARAFPNCISFGMNFPGDKDMCHQADEFVDINKLLLSSNIYAKAIYNLIS